MPRSFLIRRIRSSIFSKMLLLYSLLIVCTVLIVIGIVLTSLSAMLREQAIGYNDQVVKTTGSYFHSQCVNFKNNQQHLYSQTYLPNDILDDMLSLLQSGSALPATDYADRYNLVNGYLRSNLMPSDDDIQDILLLNRDCSWYMQASRNGSAEDSFHRFSQIESVLKENDHSSIADRKLSVIPAFRSGISRKSGYSYAIYDYIRDEAGYSGYLAYSFDVQNVALSYAQFNRYLLGSVLILTPEGDVIFDSSGKNYGRVLPYASKMRRQSSGTFTENGSIFNYTQDDTFDFITVGVIPKSSIYRRVNLLNTRILLTCLICLISAILFTFLITRLFSRQVQAIVATIKKIQKGDFSARVPIGRGKDEIQLIAHNLNIMSEKIDHSIKKEYVYELRQKDALLKQKTAQLYALQLQINPHFLYNTLETIRMTALDTGDDDTGQMIKILARMLRSSLKGDTFISIKEELQNCEAYLDLIKIRFGDRLRVCYEIDPGVTPYAIPKNLMQPIIENSIVHGGKTNSITIRGARQGEDIGIAVIDNGEGIPAASLREINRQLDAPYSFQDSRIGILNVNSRIKLIYGNRYGLKIRSGSEKGTVVTVTIPARKKEEMP